MRESIQLIDYRANITWLASYLCPNHRKTLFEEVASLDKCFCYLLQIFFIIFNSSNEYKPFWSTEGCEVKEHTNNLTVCKCNHLTHFGILFDATGRSSTKVS